MPMDSGRRVMVCTDGCGRSLCDWRPEKTVGGDCSPDWVNETAPALVVTRIFPGLRCPVRDRLSDAFRRPEHADQPLASQGLQGPRR